MLASLKPITLGLLLLLGHAACQKHDVGSTRETGWPLSEDRSLLATGLGNDGTILAATVERTGDTGLVRLLRCSKSGNALQSFVMPLQHFGSVRAFVLDGEIVLGWLDDANSLWLGEIVGGQIRQKKILDRPNPSQFILRKMGSGRKLFVEQFEPIPNPKNFAEVEQRRRFLCEYDMKPEGPQFVGRVCLEEYPFIDSYDLRIGIDGDDVLLWQVYGARCYRFPDDKPPSEDPQLEAKCTWIPMPPRMLRVAKWSSERLEWERRYIGTESLIVAMDSRDCSTVIVLEPKNGIMGPAMIACAVKAKDGKVKPLPDIVSPFAFTRISGRNACWAAAVRSNYNDPILNGHIVVFRYDAEFNLVATQRVPARNVVDYCLVADGENLYLVTLGEKGISVQRVSE